jgi:hypothetical protein
LCRSEERSGRQGEPYMRSPEPAVTRRFKRRSSALLFVHERFGGGDTEKI